MKFQKQSSKELGVWLTLLCRLVSVQIGPHEPSEERVGATLTDTKVEVGSIWAPEEALVVQTTEFGIENGLVLGKGTGSEQEGRQHGANQDGQQAKHRHDVEGTIPPEAVVRSMGKC